MKLTDAQILATYNMIQKHWKKYLEKKNVKLPLLKNKDGTYRKGALVLVRLAYNYPQTDVVSKQELTEFIKQYYPDTNDTQQGRHLSAQDGWNIISGTRGEITNFSIPHGFYKLITLKEKHPSYLEHRRTGIDGCNFEELKKLYDYRCAVCGCREGEPHRIKKSVKVKLQEGHMNPCKDLVPGNIIPQCQVCNRPDRNRWIYDNTGRVIEIAQTEDGRRVVEKFINNTDTKTKYFLYNMLKKLLKL